MTYDEFKEWFNSQELPMAPKALVDYIKANDIASAGSSYDIFLELDDALIKINIGEKNLENKFVARSHLNLNPLEETDGIPCLQHIDRYEDYTLDVFLGVLEELALIAYRDYGMRTNQYNLMLKYHYRKQREKKTQEQTEKETCDAD
jgi:hypothetical protein